MSQYLTKEGLQTYDNLLKGYLPPVKSGTGTLSLTSNTGTASGVGSVALGVSAYATGENAVSLNCGTYAKLSSSGITNPTAKVTSVSSSSITCSLNAVAANALKNYDGWNKEFYIVYNGTDYLISSVTITFTKIGSTILSGTATLNTPEDYSSSITKNTYIEAIKFSDKGATGKNSLSANSGLAEGELSCAINDITYAKGKGAFASGGGSKAIGDYSAAMNQSEVNAPSALGCGNVIINSNAHGAFGNGHGNVTDGAQSAIFGFESTIGSNGNQAFVTGAWHNTDNKRVLLSGIGHTTTRDDQVLLGSYSSAASNTLLAVGNGSSNGASNAFHLTTSYTYTMDDGELRTVATRPFVAQNYLSCTYNGTILATNSVNNGSDGFQIAQANGFNSVSLGKGTQANADMSFAANNQTTAAYGSSSAFGYKTISTTSSQFVCGTGDLEDPNRTTRNSDCYFRVSTGWKDGLAVTKEGTTRIGINGNLYELYIGEDPGSYSSNTIYFIY